MSIVIDKQTRDLINRLNKADEEIIKLKGSINKILNKSTSLVATGSFGSSQSIPSSYDGLDTTALHSDIAAEISALTEKTVIVDTDLLLIEDSADSNNKKKVQVTNIVDSLKAEIDALGLARVTTDANIISAVEGEATLDLTGLVTFLKDSAIRLYADVAKTKYWDVYGTLDDRLIIDYWDGTDYQIGLIWDYDGGTDPTFSFSNTRMVAKQFTTDNVVKISKFVDEDNMVSDSAVYVPTQQSVKAYVDGKDHDHATPIGVHAANPTNVNHLTDAQVAALHAVYTDAEALASSMEGIRIRPHFIVAGNGATYTGASYGQGYVRMPAADADCYGIWSFILPDHINWNGGFKVVVRYNQSGPGAYSVIWSVSSHKLGVTPVSQGWDILSSSTAYDFPTGTGGVMYEKTADLPSANSDQGDVIGVAIQSDASNTRTLDIYGVYLIPT